MFSHKVLLFSGFIISAYSNLLFDYGILRGNDVIGEAGYSQCSDNIALDMSITFLNEEYDNLLVCTNGAISFGGSSSGRPLIGVFWDAFSVYNGLIYFAQSINYGDVLDEIDSAIISAGFDYSSSTFAFLATYLRVTAYYDDNNEASLQVAIATDGTYTYCIFHYVEMDYEENSGVSIGFFTADGNNYRHPYSNDQSLFPNLLTHSNVGVAGRWIYRIDTATITDPYESYIAVGAQEGGDELGYIPDIFFDFGLLVEDQRITDDVNECSLEIVIIETFTFYATEYSSMYVCTNGIVTFDNANDGSISHAFPNNDQPIVAAYWEEINMDQDISDGVLFHRYDYSSSVLGDIDDAITSAGLDYGSTTHALIATWVEGSWENDFDQKSTFQAVIASDGEYTYSIFNYYELNFETDEAIMGFDAGDLENAYMHPDSLSYDLNNLVSESNVGVPGRWIYRIDTAEITETEVESDENGGRGSSGNIMKCALIALGALLIIN